MRTVTTLCLWLNFGPQGAQEFVQNECIFLFINIVFCIRTSNLSEMSIFE